MSLYNALFGVNPFATVFLSALDISTDDVPRFRDIYLTELNGRDVICVYTRTGGGNREFYDCEESCRSNYPEYFEGDEPPTGPWNADLRKIDGFLFDADDDFDCTYAYFYYEIPPSFAHLIEGLKTAGGADDPAAKFKAVIEDMGKADKQDDPAVQRALAVGKQILGAIVEAEKAADKDEDDTKVSVVEI